MISKKKILVYSLTTTIIIYILLSYIGVDITGHISDGAMTTAMLIGDCEKLIEVSSNNDNTEVYQCSDNSFRAITLAGGSGVKAFGSYGNKIITREVPMSRNLLLHELGHNMKYPHVENKSIMNPNRTERTHPDRNIRKEDIEIAEKYEGFRVINWSKLEDINYINREIQNGNISKTSTFIINENIEGYSKSNCHGIYYTDIPKWKNKTKQTNDFYAYCR